MEHVVQVGHPKIIQPPSAEYESISGVFEYLFRENDESIYVFWNDIPLRIRYRQDLYSNFDEILAMSWLVHSQDTGETLVTLKNQILEAQLELRWHEDSLQVDASFAEASPVYKMFCDSLNEGPNPKISRRAFLKEWHTLLHQIVVSLDAANVKIKDGTERRKLEMLRAVDQQIEGFGVLYERVISQCLPQ